MSQRDKLVDRFCGPPRPTEARFADVRRLLEAFGWMLAREEGSHAHFKKPGQRTITIPRHGGRKVRRAYLELICERLGLDE
ncbi:MAG: type II toxin-antitoxin system HicA family toxin [Chloroflexota bacterium]|nr:type II toxin-antitoxin system HicA family toxin [Chloroflexota bacterium]